MIQLRCRIDGSLRTFPLAGEEVRIGRGPGNEIRLPDPSVSRHHAVLERDPRGWMIRDFESTNGTRHNGARVQRAAIAPGDRLKIGAFELAVEDRVALLTYDALTDDRWAAGESIRELRVTEATVLFADLVGFTAFAERASPEEVSATIAVNSGPGTW